MAPRVSRRAASLSDMVRIIKEGGPGGMRSGAQRASTRDLHLSYVKDPVPRQAFAAPPEVLDKDRRLEGAEQRGAGDEGDAVGDVAAGPPDEAVGRHGDEEQAEMGDREAEEAHGLDRPDVALEGERPAYEEHAEDDGRDQVDRAQRSQRVQQQADPEEGERVQEDVAG